MTARPARIEDYALLGDGQGAALVHIDGTVAWLCLPRFDSPSTCAALLDPHGGHFALRPVEPHTSTRSYLDDTLVLRTEHRTERGTIAVYDALAFGPGERGHLIGRESPHVLVRVVEGLEGEVEIELEVAPRFEYGLTRPWVDLVSGGARFRGGPAAATLSAPMSLAVHDASVRASLRVQAGDRRGFSLALEEAGDMRPGPLGSDAAVALLDDTVEAWRSWQELHDAYDGPYRDFVRHSGRVLQALTYMPTGAIVAAPTTSLPEEIGGSRNWDYRYCWVRDASLTLEALWVAACPDEAAGFFDFFATAAGGVRRDCADTLQILYSVRGERLVPEHVLDHLAGFAGSQPVRIGNGAARQTQLDVYGELLGAACTLSTRIGALDESTALFLCNVADAAASRWRDTDRGIWEVRGEPRHFLHSKLLCWVALDRAVRLQPLLGTSPSRVVGWSEERDLIRSTILEHGWHDEVGAFTQSFGSPDLDAAALVIPLVGFLPATDPRVRSTIEAVRRDLAVDGLVYRYRSGDGLPGGEGTFAVCTCWLAHCLALLGDVDGAYATLDTVLAYANDVDLLAEEIDPITNRLLGNFPQAFTHIGIVNAAWAIAQAERAVSQV